MARHNTYQVKISRNRKYFDRSLTAAAAMLQRKEYDEAAVYLNSIAKFASENCTGYYANWQLEGMLNEIGRTIVPNNVQPKLLKEKRRLKVLHLASELYNTGGGSKLVLNWVKNDTANDHKILLTMQAIKDMPVEIVASSGLGQNCFLPFDVTKTVLERASALRQIAGEYDCVILHVHPYDVIPVIAFSVPGLPPVALLNHADHIFWIGVSVTDMVLQIRRANIKQDEERRNVKSQYFLPIPVPADKIEIDYSSIRKEIGIRPNQVVMLSTGHEYKYIPTEKYNFFTHVTDVLSQHPDALLLLAGTGKDSVLAKKYGHPQIRFLGQVTDLYKYETACDIYIEGYPFPSFTAMLQAGKKCKPIQLMYEPLPVVKFFDDETTGFAYPTEDTWDAELNKLVSDKDFREQVAVAQQQHISEFYTEESWLLRLAKMYNNLTQLSHKVNANSSSYQFTTGNEEYLASIGHDTYIPNFSFRKKTPGLMVNQVQFVVSRTKYKLFLKNLYRRFVKLQ